MAPRVWTVSPPQRPLQHLNSAAAPSLSGSTEDHPLRVCGRCMRWDIHQFASQHIRPPHTVAPRSRGGDPDRQPPRTAPPPGPGPDPGCAAGWSHDPTRTRPAALGAPDDTEPRGLLLDRSPRIAPPIPSGTPPPPAEQHRCPRTGHWGARPPHTMVPGPRSWVDPTPALFISPAPRPRERGDRTAAPDPDWTGWRPAVLVPVWLVRGPLVRGLRDRGSCCFRGHPCRPAARSARTGPGGPVRPSCMRSVYAVRWSHVHISTHTPTAYSVPAAPGEQDRDPPDPRCVCGGCMRARGPDPRPPCGDPAPRCSRPADPP